MEANENILKTARALGKSIGGEISEKSFESLELAFVSKIPPKRFHNLPTLRVRAHTKLYWRRGFLKTTIEREFIKTIPSQFKVKQLTSATNEILCGSIQIPKNPHQYPRVVPPTLASVDFAIIFEHGSFLRHGGPIGAKLSILNDTLEGDRITNSLVKLGQMQIDPSQKAELEKLGVRYDPSEATLSFEPDCVMISSSHPYDPRTLSLLVNSGHFDRFRIVQFPITTDIARKFFSEEYRLNRELQIQLKKQNEMLCKVKINSIETAPQQLMNPVFEKLFMFTELPDFRIKGDLLRAISGHMILRHYDEDNLKEVYKASDYNVQDVKFIMKRLKGFIEPRIEPLVSKSPANLSNNMRKINTCMKITLRCLSDGQWHSPQEVFLCIVDRFRKLGRTISQATIYNGLKRLEGLEKITRRHGRYKIAVPELTIEQDREVIV